MIPGSSSGTCPRSGTPPAPGQAAAGPPPKPTSSTTSRTRQADGHACATAALSAAPTTGSNSTPAGTSTSSPTEPSGGPPHPGASTPPNQPATRFDSPLRALPRVPQRLKLGTCGPGRSRAAGDAQENHQRPVEAKDAGVIKHPDLRADPGAAHGGDLVHHDPAGSVQAVALIRLDQEAGASVGSIVNGHSVTESVSK